MKKVKLTIWAILIAVITVTSFNACKKDSVFKDNQQEIGLSKDIDALTPPTGFGTLFDFRVYARETYAEALAKIMHNQSVKAFIKTHVTETIDGETELLHAKHFNHNFIINNTSYTFSELLASNSHEDVSFFDSLILIYDPRLNILIPDDYYPENWDILSLTPKVVAMHPYHDGFIENDDYRLQIPIYDTEGTAGTTSVVEEPEELTVVVGETESVQPFTKPYTGENTNPYYQNSYYVYFVDGGDLDTTQFNELKIDEIENDGSRNVDRRNCERDNTGRHDLFWRLRVDGKESAKVIRHWARGRMRLRFDYIMNWAPLTAPEPDFDSEKNVLHKYSRRQARNREWLVVNSTLRKWDNIDLTNRCKFVFWDLRGKHMDSDIRTHTVTLRAKTGQITAEVEYKVPVEHSRKDKRLTEKNVEYCDKVLGNGTIYKSGSLIEFQIKLK